MNTFLCKPHCNVHDQHQACSKVRTDGTVEQMPERRVELPGVWYEVSSSLGCFQQIFFLFRALRSSPGFVSVVLSCKRCLVGHIHSNGYIIQDVSGPLP